jgi:cytochrome P450
MDDPDHRRYRAIMQGWFTPQRVMQSEPLIRVAARDLIRTAGAAQPHCDLVHLARLYTIDVLFKILGAPDIDYSRVLRITRLLFDSGEKVGPAPFRTAEDPARHAEVLSSVYSEFESYFIELAERNRKGLQKDFLYTLLSANVNKARVPLFEAVSYFALLGTAGHDTAASAIAGGLWALAENPDELQKLKSTQRLIPQLVQEAIRWTTPVQHFMRTATENVRLSGQNIAPGDWLMLCYLSGNRDEQVFPNADRFHVAECARPNLAFGYGAHTCLGKYLANFEMRVFFEELFTTLLDIRVVARPQRSSSIFVGGPQRVPVRLRLARDRNVRHSHSHLL